MAPDARVYVRRLDGYEYKELPGTAGVYFGAPSADGRTYHFIAPIAPGATQLRLARVPLDGTTPATTVTEWKNAWSLLSPQENGDLIVREGTASFVRIPKDGGAILAAPFDVESMEIHGAPVAVWSGLSAFATCLPGRYVVTRDGVLFCRPGQLGANRAIVLLDATGRLVSWSSKGRALDFPPAISPDGRQLACQIISTRGIDEIWISPDGKVLAFQTLESGELSSYVAVFHPGGAAGRPVETETSGSSWHEWSADGKSLFVQDERNHRMRIPVSTTPELAVGAPTEICDFDKLRITMCSALPGDRFLVGLRNVNEDEVASYNGVLNWTEILKRKMEAER